MLIERPPKLFRLLLPKGLYRPREKGHKCVYLTFDDGPIPVVTPWVLDLLDRYGIKETFFMVGENAGRHPELLAEVRRRGHSVGNHTFHHLQGAKVTSMRYLRDIEHANEMLQTRLFRPPHGWLHPAQARTVSRKYRLVMYDLITRDYSWRLDARRVFRNVRRYTRTGSVIVFHDSLKSWPRLETALPQSLEWLIEQGYEFRTLDQYFDSLPPEKERKRKGRAGRKQ